jgi:hypothetical protein
LVDLLEYELTVNSLSFFLTITMLFYLYIPTAM